MLARYDGVNQVELGSLAVMGDKVYYCCRGDDGFLTLYCVPKDGSAAPEPVKPEGFDQILWSVSSMGSGYLFATTEEISFVYGLDKATGQLKPLVFYDGWITSVNMVDNGRRYAAMIYRTVGSELVIGDLNCEAPACYQNTRGFLYTLTFSAYR